MLMNFCRISSVNLPNGESNVGLNISNTARLYRKSRFIIAYNLNDARIMHKFRFWIYFAQHVEERYSNEWMSETTKFDTLASTFQ